MLFIIPSGLTTIIHSALLLQYGRAAVENRWGGGVNTPSAPSVALLTQTAAPFLLRCLNNANLGHLFTGEGGGGVLTN